MCTEPQNHVATNYVKLQVSWNIQQIIRTNIRHCSQQSKNFYTQASPKNPFFKGGNVPPSRICSRINTSTKFSNCLTWLDRQAGHILWQKFYRKQLSITRCVWFFTNCNRQKWDINQALLLLDHCRIVDMLLADLYRLTKYWLLNLLRQSANCLRACTTTLLAQ